MPGGAGRQDYLLRNFLVNLKGGSRGCLVLSERLRKFRVDLDQGQPRSVIRITRRQHRPGRTQRGPGPRGWAGPTVRRSRCTGPPVTQTGSSAWSMVDGDREASREQIRELFRRYRLAMPMARLAGNAAEMPSLVTRPFASASVWASTHQLAAPPGRTGRTDVPGLAARRLDTWRAAVAVHPNEDASVLDYRACRSALASVSTSSVAAIRAGPAARRPRRRLRRSSWVVIQLSARLTRI